MKNSIKMIALLILLLASLALAGCFSSKARYIKAFVKPYQADVTAKNYVLQPPDEIEVHCSRVPEVHLQTQRIRPDGKISFESIGEIQAAGKTTTQLAEILRTKIKELYTLPNEKAVQVRIGPKYAYSPKNNRKKEDS